MNQKNEKMEEKNMANKETSGTDNMDISTIPGALSEKERQAIDAMSPAQLEYAFRKQRHLYLKEDAKRQAEAILAEDQELLDLLGDADYNALAERFDDAHDCNLDDNSQWEHIIWSYVNEKDRKIKSKAYVGTPTTTSIVLRWADRSRETEVGLEKLLELLGKDPSDPPVEAVLRVAREDCAMTASVEPKEKEYPGIAIDAEDARKQQLYVCRAEMPHEDLPDSIEARLYAGYADYETDAPIAMVKHRLNDMGYCEAGKDFGGDKIVYVDTDLALSCELRGEIRKLPEHVRDEEERN